MQSFLVFLCYQDKYLTPPPPRYLFCHKYLTLDLSVFVPFIPSVVLGFWLGSSSSGCRGMNSLSLCLSQLLRNNFTRLNSVWAFINSFIPLFGNNPWVPDRRWVCQLQEMQWWPQQERSLHSEKGRKSVPGRGSWGAKALWLKTTEKASVAGTQRVGKTGEVVAPRLYCSLGPWWGIMLCLCP